MTTATDPSALDDHALTAWLADAAGDRLLEVRRQGLVGRELKDAGHEAAQEVLARLLAAYRPHDAVLSEEAADGGSVGGVRAGLSAAAESTRCG